MSHPQAIALTEAERRRYEANIVKAYVYQFLTSLQLWWPIWVIYLQQQRGFSLTQITAMDAPFFLAQIVAEVPTGAVADRFGRKTSLIIGSCTLGLAVFVFGLADNFLIILASYMLWAIASAFQSGADSALLYDTLKLLGREEEYAKIQGRSLALMPAASLIGGLIGAPLAAATDLATPILISAAIAGLGAVVALTFAEPPIHSTKLDYLSTIKQGMRQSFGQPTVRYALFYTTALGVATFAPIIFLQPFLRGHGASISSLGLLQTPMRLVGAVGFLIAYRVVAGAGQWRTLTLLPLISVSGYIGLALWDSIYAVSMFPLISFVGSLRSVTISTYINRRIGSEQRATILSLQALLFALLIAAAEPALGAIADTWSLQLTFFVTGLIAIVLAAPVLALWRRAEADEDVAGGPAAGRAPQPVSIGDSPAREPAEP